jgi:dihydrofolate reductase
MRKLKLQTQVTIDGYMAGPNGEMDWLGTRWDDGLMAYIAALSKNVDGILLGRKLAEGFIPHWAEKPQSEPPEAIAMMNDTKKTVFSKTLKVVPAAWPNTELAGGDLAREVNALKARAGSDLIAYGGGTFVSNLLDGGLVDELHLVVNPVALGSGMKVFKARAKYALVKATSFGCGIAVMHYRSEGSAT